MTVTHRPALAAPGRVWPRVQSHLPALVPGLLAVGLMLVWAAHNGGYDADTWYWGALLLVCAGAAALIWMGPRAVRFSRWSRWALVAFGLYVLWSYLSISWAQSPGDALQGSNRALLYLLMFALMAALPWTVEGALIALIAFAVGVGVIALVLLVELGSTYHIASLVIGGRLVSPTGYFNSTPALFTMGTLVAIVLAARRELPGLLRGVLLALAAADLQLAVIGQSRGWLFTLPLVLVLTLVLVPSRIRVVGAAVLPILATLIPVHRLIRVYDANSTAAVNHAAKNAGETALVLCAATLFVGTLIAWGDTLLGPRTLSPLPRRLLGGTLAAIAIAVGIGGTVAATHGHPISFVKRQWNGFSHPSPSGSVSGSNFATVGSGRYDFWRVSLDALAAHPIGGLGQDNFADYYLLHRRTREEPAWTHSLEMRLLASTGLVGFALFAAFVVCAMTAAVKRRRSGGPVAAAASAAAMLPFLVWLIHGSVDWFWEMPALSGPALGFLGMASAVGAAAPEAAVARSRLRSPRVGRPLLAGLGLLTLLAAVVVLGFPYLSVREVSLASDVRQRNPTAALSHLSDAARLNPLSPDPGRIGGTIALQTGQFDQAQQRFRQAISREPGGWFAWLGAGLAASSLGESTRAHHDFVVAASINNRQAAVRTALARVYSQHPLTADQALGMFVLAK